MSLQRSISLTEVNDTNNNKYVYMETFGNWQLANQMFQYIVLHNISKLTGRKLVIIKDKINETPHKNLIKQHFSIMFDYIYTEDIDVDDMTSFKEPKDDLCYDEYFYDKIAKINEKYLNIEGFFQSYKYFLDTKPVEIFSLRGEYIIEISITFKRILDKLNIENFNETNNLISIHVRRGDYIKYNNYHPILPINYYIKNINDYLNLNNLDNTNNMDNTNITDNTKLSNKRFLIFSDDIEWCQRVFHSIKDISYFSTNQAITDLFLMSYCNINIISNSSFSLMAHFLNTNINKKIIHPKMFNIEWFGVQGPKYDIDDLISLTEKPITQPINPMINVDNICNRVF